MTEIGIRRVEQGDLPALLEIYNHYVINTSITFDIEPRTLEQRRAWFDGFARAGRYQCFVAVKEAAGRSAGPVRTATTSALPTTPPFPSSIYLAPEVCGQGLGKRLYATLFEALKGEDIHRIFGGITLPNDASVGLHRSFGFEPVGVYREVGRKFGRFWDVAAYLRPFSPRPSNPRKPLL